MSRAQGLASALSLLPGLVYTRHVYDHLFDIYAPIGVGVFVVVVLAMGIAVLRYRRRAPPAAARWRENNRLEGVYALLLACMVAFLLYLTYSAEHKVDTVSAQERPSLTIDVISSRWEWTFTYPGYGITARSGEVGHQPLVVPTGEAIRFKLSSIDVIHSFWIPALRFKRQTFPDYTQDVTLAVGSAGLYQGQCAEFCGLRHAEMIFTVRAVSPRQFTAWAAGGGVGPIS
ncbi:MAG TPA: cytochrome c oxidase subunit II [Solirubrobacteraceae bacterium]|jgi:cytochrome c oxidase subunit 2|nr:cytochrome c oxidase subunit II [Solirubrobacteraceae bacterium]